MYASIERTALEDILLKGGALRLIPLIGRLGDCSKQDLKEAFLEVAATTFFATMPLWFLPTVGNFLFTTTASINEAVKTGELFIYAAALSGPLVYVITKRYGTFSMDYGTGQPHKYPLTISFPYGGLFVGLALIMCIISGFTFTVLKNPSFSTPEDLKRINFDGIIALSWLSFAISTIILFCVTAYRNMLENISKVSQRRQEDDFFSQWKAVKND